MVLFTKESLDVDKPILVVNLPLVRFIGGIQNQERTCNIQGVWDPERWLSMITTVGVPVEEDMDDIEIKSKDMVIHLECE